MADAPTAKFEERLTGIVAPEAYFFGVPLALIGGVAWGAGALAVALLFTALAAFVVSFFRNPNRVIPAGERAVVSPADGRIIDVAEIEVVPGEKALRIAIFLSVFNVHVNRAPLAGRVVAIERTGTKFLAAFNPDAESLNVRLDLTLETASGARIRFAQITGLIARRIVCHARVGDWLEKGTRYGMIRFGSRTDVVLPLGSLPRVVKGERVRGGSTVLAELAR
ncbi:MAG TPA: phosphatidylserine decarboxylase [Myxococcota bacterium]|jgi:phosphatidylserine decarboxylase